MVWTSRGRRRGCWQSLQRDYPGTMVDSGEQQAPLDADERRVKRLGPVEVGDCHLGAGPLEICGAGRILDHGADASAGGQQPGRPAARWFLSRDEGHRWPPFSHRRLAAFAAQLDQLPPPQHHHLHRRKTGGGRKGLEWSGILNSCQVVPAGGTR
jgi:hypothetical protein